MNQTLLWQDEVEVNERLDQLKASKINETGLQEAN